MADVYTSHIMEGLCLLQEFQRTNKEFFFFFWPRCRACGILVPRPGIEPVPPAVEAQGLNHWTARKFPRISKERYSTERTNYDSMRLHKAGPEHFDSGNWKRWCFCSESMWLSQGSALCSRGSLRIFIFLCVSSHLWKDTNPAHWISQGESGFRWLKSQLTLAQSIKASPVHAGKSLQVKVSSSRAAPAASWWEACRSSVPSLIFLPLLKRQQCLGQLILTLSSPSFKLEAVRAGRGMRKRKPPKNDPLPSRKRKCLPRIPLADFPLCLLGQNNSLTAREVMRKSIWFAILCGRRAGKRDGDRQSWLQPPQARTVNVKWDKTCKTICTGTRCEYSTRR